MAKKPHSPQEIFEEFTNEVKQLFDKELKSIILYGSGARGEYQPKKSDINFLVVLTKDGIGQLAKAMSLTKKWAKQNVATPLFLTEGYIHSSLDAFPIEFLNMKKYHQVVYGNDPLESLDIAEKDLRLRCEEQVKGKLLHLREDFLLTRGKKRLLEQLISITVPTFVSIFTALLDLKKVEVPTLKREVFLKTADEFELDRSVFERVINVREKQVKLDKSALLHLTEQYIEQIRRLANIVDQW